MPVNRARRALAAATARRRPLLGVGRLRSAAGRPPHRPDHAVHRVPRRPGPRARPHRADRQRRGRQRAQRRAGPLRAAAATRATTRRGSSCRSSTGRDIPVGTTATLRRTSLLGEHFVDLTASRSGAAPPARSTRTATPSPPRIRTAPDRRDELGRAADLHRHPRRLRGRRPQRIRGVRRHRRARPGHDRELGPRGAQRPGPAAQRRSSPTCPRWWAPSPTSAATWSPPSTASPPSAPPWRPTARSSGDLIDDLGATSALLAEHRQRIVTALTDLTDLAATTNDVVLEPHADAARRAARRPRSRRRHARRQPPAARRPDRRPPRLQRADPAGHQRCRPAQGLRLPVSREHVRRIGRQRPGAGRPDGDPQEEGTGP